LGRVTPERYVLANLAPAFSHLHAALLPGLSLPDLAAGQGATVQGLIQALDMAGYLEARIVQRLVAEGRVQPIEGAPPLTQPIYAAIHYRNRHRAVWRRLTGALRATLGEAE
jgi:DNA-binding transcriptional LysR family regulator